MAADFTAARVRRSNREIGNEEAQHLAAELHDIIGAVRKFYASVPLAIPDREDRGAESITARKAVRITAPGGSPDEVRPDVPFESMRDKYLAERGIDEAIDEASDVVETLLRTAVDTWPADGGEAANESIWLMERLTTVGGEELYLRYLRLCDRISIGELGIDRAPTPTPTADPHHPAQTPPAPPAASTTAN